jgi:hypothetical protein
MIRVGIVGTSPWADAMYLPALKDHSQGQIVAVCGRNREKADAFAARWNVPNVYTDYRDMIASGKLDALIVASSNDSHYPITMAPLHPRSTPSWRRRRFIAGCTCCARSRWRSTQRRRTRWSPKP